MKPTRVRESVRGAQVLILGKKSKGEENAEETSHHKSGKNPVEEVIKEENASPPEEQQHVHVRPSPLEHITPLPI